MSICKQFIVKDIMEYELNNNINILLELSQNNLFVIVDMIKLGNGFNSTEEAEEYLDRILHNKQYDDIIIDLIYEIIGKKPDEETEQTSKSSDNKVFDIMDIFSDYYNSIQAVDKNFSLSEFQSMSTRYMFKYAEGIKERFINERNIKLQEQYTNAMLIGQMISGKLKECPQLDENGNLKKKSLIDKIKELNRG